MHLRRTLLIALLALVGCATPPAPTPPIAETEIPATATSTDSQQLDFKLASGTYRCELDQQVEVQRTPGDNHRIFIDWTGQRYQLARNPSHSGLPRFEDVRSGLVWIDLPWKGMLLDQRNNKPLASDCRLS